jgi:hypothetical protein
VYCLSIAANELSHVQVCKTQASPQSQKSLIDDDPASAHPSIKPLEPVTLFRRRSILKQGVVAFESLQTICVMAQLNLPVLNEVAREKMGYLA